MKIIITSPSLNTNYNVSGVSAVTQFIMNTNSYNDYVHFELGKKDQETRNLYWFFRILKAYLKWVRLISTQKDVLVHFNLSLTTRSAVRDSPLMLFARLFRRPMVIHVHGGEFLTHRKAPLWVAYILKYDLCCTNPKIVLSVTEEQALRRQFNCSKIFVLPNCIELEEARKFDRASTKNEVLTLLFMARIVTAKGLEFIFEALECLKKKGIRFKFIMAGKGPEEQLYAQKFSLLLGEDFEYRGAVFGGCKAELLKSCDVFLLPSLYEGLPMALLEAMSFGLVPIATNVGSINSAIENEVNGILLDKDSAALSSELASAIEKLHEDSEYKRILSTNARRSVFSFCEPKAYIARLNEIYSYA